MATKRVTAQAQTFAKAYGSGDKPQGLRPRYVHVIFDDCPEQWGDKKIIGVYAEGKAAKDAMLKIKGGDPVSGQYIEVQRWRVK